MMSASSVFEYYPYIISVAVTVPLLLTYLISSFSSPNLFYTVSTGGRPPLAPYSIPLIGHGLSFFWNTGVVNALTQSLHKGIVSLQLFTTRITFVSGSDNVAAVWRSRDLDAQAVTLFSLSQFFSTPKSSLKVYQGDNSGISPQPHPDSDLKPTNRYFFQNRKHIVGFFNGSGLKHMGNRFSRLLSTKIDQLEVGDTWTEHEDLYNFIQDLMFGPAVEAMCGPVLLQQNPTFGKDFWKLDSDILYFFKAYPWWMVPGASRNRTKLLQGVKRWHAYARTNFVESCIEWDGHDPYYGSPLMRSRQEYLRKIDHLDEDALASQDLGLLWAENANSIPAIFWMVYETLMQPTQLSQALIKIEDSQPGCFHHANPSLDVESVCNIPILQSMYAETLRLYTSLFSLRSAIHGDFTLDGFTIPKNELIAVDSRVTAMDKSIWNTRADEGEEEGPLPLDRFWAERFLVYPKDPASGPLRGGPSNQQKNPTSSAQTESNTPRFTTEGLAGAWTPYGGGSRQCPGRNFAKQEIIVGFALLLSEFEIELVDADKRGTVKPDMKYYGLGTLPPKTKTPFRIRRRVRGPAEQAQAEAM